MGAGDTVSSLLTFNWVGGGEVNIEWSIRDQQQLKLTEALASFANIIINIETKKV